MSTNNIDETNLTDERVLVKRIADEEETISKLEKELVERQERKKKIVSKIRTLNHKTKTLEDSILQNAIVLERHKLNNDKYISKVNKKELNQIMDKKCEEIFSENIGDVDLHNIEIDVEFERVMTTFSISENKAVRKNGKEEIVQKTFKEMKESVAPFFSLSPNSFFFTDAQGSIFLDNLPVRQTLMPLGVKVKKSLPLLRIVLRNNNKYDEEIAERIKDYDVQVRPTKLKAETKDSYEIEQAKKKAEERILKSEEYQKARERKYKIKGFISAVLYFILIGLWLYNLFTHFDFEEDLTMRNAVRSSFINFENVQPDEFYNEIKRNIFENRGSKNKNYVFGSLNYLQASVVVNKYKQVPCQYTVPNFDKKVCINPNEKETQAFSLGDQTYFYDETPEQIVSLPMKSGSFENAGYRLPIDFSDPKMQQKISDFANREDTKLSSFNLMVFNPSLSKIGCVFRVMNHFNNDSITTEKFIYIYDFHQENEGVRISGSMILAIAGLLLLASIINLFDLVPDSKADLDVDLILLSMKKKKLGKKEEDDVLVHVKVWAFKVWKYTLKIYPPDLITVGLIIANAIIRLRQQDIINSADFSATSLTCPRLIRGEFITMILSAILILLMMIVLLRYISQFVSFLSGFILILQNLIRNIYSLGIVIIWIAMTVTIFGMYTIGPYYYNFERFSFIYTAVLLLIIKKNIFYSDEESIESYRNMKDNIGAYALVLVIIFTYFTFTFLIIKVIQSIIIRSIKDAEEQVKDKEKKTKKLRETSLSLIKAKFFEEYKTKLKTK